MNFSVESRNIFIKNGLSIDLRKDHIIIENSQTQTENKIADIIESAGFCPLLSSKKIKGNFVFTVVPYKIPDFFAKNFLPYFRFDEISTLLKTARFVKRKDRVPKDKWMQINTFRAMVQPALNSGIAELIKRYLKEEHPIVEIGSGIGYSLPDHLSRRMIRIQPSTKECQLLKQSISTPVYQIDCEGFYHLLKESRKKVSLFFALNVFDIMDPKTRKATLSLLSRLQNRGDRILILLDTNPCLDSYSLTSFFFSKKLQWIKQQFLLEIPLNVWKLH